MDHNLSIKLSKAKIRPTILKNLFTALKLSTAVYDRKIPNPAEWLELPENRPDHHGIRIISARTIPSFECRSHRYILAESENGDIWVSFIGTNSFSDFVQDLNYFPFPLCPPTFEGQPTKVPKKLKFHRGFYNKADTIPLEPFFHFLEIGSLDSNFIKINSEGSIPPNRKNFSERKLYFCGHSLGGAVGILTLFRMFLKKPLQVLRYLKMKRIHVYSIGTPQLADVATVKYFTALGFHKAITTIVHDHDPVPNLCQLETDIHSMISNPKSRGSLHVMRKNKVVVPSIQLVTSSSNKLPDVQVVDHLHHRKTLVKLCNVNIQNASAPDISLMEQNTAEDNPLSPVSYFPTKEMNDTMNGTNSGLDEISPTIPEGSSSSMNLENQTSESMSSTPPSAMNLSNQISGITLDLSSTPPSALDIPPPLLDESQQNYTPDDVESSENPINSNLQEKNTPSKSPQIIHPTPTPLAAPSVTTSFFKKKFNINIHDPHTDQSTPTHHHHSVFLNHDNHDYLNTIDLLNSASNSRVTSPHQTYSPSFTNSESDSTDELDEEQSWSSYLYSSLKSYSDSSLIEFEPIGHFYIMIKGSCIVSLDQVQYRVHLNNTEHMTGPSPGLWKALQLHQVRVYTDYFCDIYPAFRHDPSHFVHLTKPLPFCFSVQIQDIKPVIHKVNLKHEPTKDDQGDPIQHFLTVTIEGYNLGYIHGVLLQPLLSSLSHHPKHYSYQMPDPPKLSRVCPPTMIFNPVRRSIFQESFPMLDYDPRKKFNDGVEKRKNSSSMTTETGKDLPQTPSSSTTPQDQIFTPHPLKKWIPAEESDPLYRFLVQCGAATLESETIKSHITKYSKPIETVQKPPTYLSYFTDLLSYFVSPEPEKHEPPTWWIEPRIAGYRESCLQHFSTVSFCFGLDSKDFLEVSKGFYIEIFSVFGNIKHAITTSQFVSDLGLIKDCL